MLTLIGSDFSLVFQMLILIVQDFSLVSRGITPRLLELEPYYLLQLLILFLQWLSFYWQIVLQLALHNINLIFLVGVPVLLLLVTVVDVPAFVPLVASIDGHVPIVVVHIQFVVISVVFIFRINSIPIPGKYTNNCSTIGAPTSCSQHKVILYFPFHGADAFSP